MARWGGGLWCGWLLVSWVIVVARVARCALVWVVSCNWTAMVMLPVCRSGCNLRALFWLRTMRLFAPPRSEALHSTPFLPLASPAVDVCGLVFSLPFVLQALFQSLAVAAATAPCPLLPLPHQSLFFFDVIRFPLPRSKDLILQKFFLAILKHCRGGQVVATHHVRLLYGCRQCSQSHWSYSKDVSPVRM